MSTLIREATAEDSPGIRRLFARTFGVELSEEEWRWKFANDPDGSFGMVAERDGEVVGNYAGWGIRLRLGGGESLVYSVGDVATDPASRGLGRAVYREMASAFYGAVGARGVPFCLGFPNERALAISHRLVGSRTLFPVREVAVPLDAFASPPEDAAAGDAVGVEFDALWSAARDAIRYGVVRDRLRVNWRFHARPTRYYRMVWTGAPVLRGWAVLSVVGERALVADYLAAGDWPGELPRLFAGAAAEARRMGARSLVFWETPGGPAADWIASLPGERRDAGFPIIVRSFDEKTVSRFADGVHLVPSLYDVV